MEEKLKTLHEMCETISREIEEANEKIRKAGGKLSAGDVDYIDKLTHTLKSIKTTIAMMEADDDGYSERYMPFYGGMSYAGGGRGGNRGGNSYRGNSYAGRRNARRDSMGRYSRDGYSYAEDEMMDIIDDIRGMMDELPAEKRRRVERLVNELER